MIMSVQVISTSFVKEESLPLTPPDSPSSDDECQKTLMIDACRETPSKTPRVGCERKKKGVVPPGEVLIAREESTSCAFPAQVSRTTGHGENDPAARHGSRETVCVMQQKGGAQPPQNTCPDMTTSGQPPLRSVLKRSGQRSRGYRVSINESKNEVLESDYVIVLREEDEPQIVCIRSLDLNNTSSDHVTLSPPEAYKDVFGYPIHHMTDLRDHNSEVSSDWGAEVHDPHCPRANLPDLVAQQLQCLPTNLTVENVRHHDQLMLDSPQKDQEVKVAKTGILKGGKYWKNGRRQQFEIPKAEKMEERRSVRFSGRDEFTTLETNGVFDNIPIEVANQAALACFLSPKFQELSNLLGEQRQEDWNLELSPMILENALNNLDDLPYHYSCAKHSPKMADDSKLNDEHISESVQRYDEMRRRLAASEGRDNNSICSDESKSSSDSQTSDCHTTESRIRRMENADVAHLAGGVIRSNSEVRRAIERNALRRSLIRFAEARKKDTNKNEKNDKNDGSLLEKLKWLTASEDVSNGNADEKEEESSLIFHQQSNLEQEPDRHPLEDQAQPHRSSMQQYKNLTTKFNQTTSYRTADITVPGDVREWKMDAELFKSEKDAQDLDIDDLSTVTYTAVPAVSIDQISDEESEKLIYSGGVRYTKEGTLPAAKNQQTNGMITITRECTRPNGETYIVDDMDEVLPDDHSSSVPSSSQSSPRLSGRSDVDGASTAESGYSSNETNSELGQILPPELDELAEFVKQDAGRMERLRRRFDEPEDHGFNRRPSVRGIKTRFGSTTDLLNQMANQLIPPPINQPTLTSTSIWPYRETSEEENGSSSQQRRRTVSNCRNITLPALKEEGSYLNSVDLPFPNNKSSDILVQQRIPPRMYTGDLPPRTREEYVRQGPPPRAQSYTTLPQSSQFGSSQNLLISPSSTVIVSNEHHHVTFTSKRPASVHGHAPTDMLMSRPQHPTPDQPHPFHYNQYNPPRAHKDSGQIIQESPHLSLSLRSSYSSSMSSNGSYNHSYHQTSPIDSSDHCQRNSYTERSYCQGWHPSSNPSYVHSHSNNFHPPIVSSQMSYTTPIVPDGTTSRQLGIVNGVPQNIDSERGVPEGASSAPRMAIDSHQYSSGHHQPPRDSGHLLRQTMNVST